VGTNRTVTVDAAVYDVDIVNRAAYSLSDVASFRISRRSPAEISVDVSLRATTDADDVVSRFNNALIDYRLRAQLMTETATIRDLIFRQAFVEADLEG
jgi:His-Xaa-Ser system protein HxsD